jgi:hypothetical protein
MIAVDRRCSERLKGARAHSKNRTESVIAEPEWAALIGAIKRSDFEKD